MKTQRNEKIMLDLIINTAKCDERIRAAIMNGSRASPTATKDMFQDYDIVYLVTDVESFVADKNWINRFGDILIMQVPDEMDGNWPKVKEKYTYLMQFEDWNRIDLTLLHLDSLQTMSRDSQSILLLDKDKLIQPFDIPSDKDYLPKPPTFKEFYDCCNEFLWVSTYVAKGIWRKQLIYSKHVAEQIVKEELLKMLTWYIGLNTDFKFSVGGYGKYFERYLEPEIWQKLLKTYVNSDYNNMWDGLFSMCDLFHELAVKVSIMMEYTFNQREFDKVLAYLHEVRDVAAP